MPEGRPSMGFAARVHDLRQCGLLRLLARQACDEAFSRDAACRDAVGYARRPMDLVLRARSRWRANPSARDQKIRGAMKERSCDVIVIGAGSTGENVADRAVKGGLTAVIVESDLVGGECSYWSCVPSKALLRPGSALQEARSVSGAREAITGQLDVAAVFKRRDFFASEWDDAGQVKWLRNANIDLLRGHGRLTGERRVSVTDRGGVTTNLTARQAVAVC